MIPQKKEILISNFKSLSTIINTTKYFCKALSFSKHDSDLIALSVSEITTNVLKYAEEGVFKVFILENFKGIRIEIKDNGPGIKDLKNAMLDGISEDETSLGLGLGVVNRAMDLFEINSSSKNGTRISMEKWLPLLKENIEYSVISVADYNYDYNGDGYLIKEFNGDSLLSCVIDGLGEGLNAYKTTQAIISLIQNNYKKSLDDIVEICDRFIKKYYKNSGIAISLLKIKPETVNYIGVGDTFIKNYSTKNEKSLHFLTKQGIVGAFTLPNLEIKTFENKHNGVYILCSDGIKDNMNKKELPLYESANTIANFIYKNYRRSYGDATVMVIKIKNNG